MRRRTVGALAILVVCLGGCSAGDAPETESSPVVETGQGDLPPRGLAARAVHTMTPLADGDLLVAGGCTVDGCSTATPSSYVVDDETIDRVGDLNEARDGHVAVALEDGRVLVAGGFSGEGQPPLGSAELYDPRTGGWQETGGLTTARGGHTAALLGDGRVLVAGGWTGPGSYTDSTEIYDPATGSFSDGPRLSAAADGLSSAPLPDGCVLVVGGQTGPQVPTADASTICPDGSLERVGRLEVARFKHGVVALESGRVLVVGGTADDAHLLRSTELYDPDRRLFQPGPLLESGRYKLSGSLVALPGDRVVVAGGGVGVELVDVDAGTSSRLDRLGSGRSSFSTVGVSAGTLLVLGGYDESIRLTRQFRSIPVTSLG